MLLVLVTAPDAVARQRLAARGADPGAVSDATVAVYEERRRAFEQPSDEEAPILRLDGNAAAGANADRILARLLESARDPSRPFPYHPQTMADVGP